MRTVAFSCERVAGHLQRATAAGVDRLCGDRRAGPAEDSGGWKITVAPTPSGARVAPGDPIDVGTGAVYDLQPEGSSALAQDESGDHVVNVALEQAP
jgi:hypothetical protein